MGVGELGSRIAAGILKAGCAGLCLRDVNEERVMGYRHCPQVAIAESEELLYAKPDLMVFSADSGSLSAPVATLLAQNGALIAFGGPEAGLDHNEVALGILTSAGKHFVPSLLCGSVGLVANVEEIFLGSCDLQARYERLEQICWSIIDEALSRGRLFHEQLATLINGE